MSKRSRRLDDVEDTPTSKRKWCCWPDCPKVRLHVVPLCEAHLTIAREIWIDLNSPDQTRFYKYSGTISEPETNPEPVKKKPEHGVVYYVRSGGYIKIGWTSTLAGRMKAYPPDSLLLATEPGTRADENRRHRQFAAHRTHGREWYAMAADLMRHIDRVKAEHGEPDPVAFAAKPVQVPQPRPRQYVGGNYRGQGLIGESRTPWRT